MLKATRQFDRKQIKYGLINFTGNASVFTIQTERKKLVKKLDLTQIPCQFDRKRSLKYFLPLKRESRLSILSKRHKTD